MTDERWDPIVNRKLYGHDLWAEFAKQVVVPRWVRLCGIASSVLRTPERHRPYWHRTHDDCNSWLCPRCAPRRARIMLDTAHRRAFPNEIWLTVEQVGEDATGKHKRRRQRARRRHGTIYMLTIRRDGWVVRFSSADLGSDSVMLEHDDGMEMIRAALALPGLVPRSTRWDGDAAPKTEKPKSNTRMIRGLYPPRVAAEAVERMNTLVRRVGAGLSAEQEAKVARAVLGHHLDAYVREQVADDVLDMTTEYLAEHRDAVASDTAPLHVWEEQ